MTVKINIPMPKSCDECPFAMSSWTNFVNGKQTCGLRYLFRFHRAKNGDESAAWELPDYTKENEKDIQCPLKENK